MVTSRSFVIHILVEGDKFIVYSPFKNRILFCAIRKSFYKINVNYYHESYKLYIRNKIYNFIQS